MADLGDTRSVGFFGKISSHGDFVSRRISPPVRAAWDNWMQSSLEASRQKLHTGWLAIYLTSPIWRFALAPGLVDVNAWNGIMMPSVDRVGRYFPLMIGAEGASRGGLLDCLEHGKEWYDRLEELALSSLESDFDFDRFETALVAMPRMTTRSSNTAVDSGLAKGCSGFAVRWSSAGLTHLQAEVPDLTSTVARALLAGHSVWWSDGSERVSPSVLVCKGLPKPATFIAMLEGSAQ